MRSPPVAWVLLVLGAGAVGYIYGRSVMPSPEARAAVVATAPPAEASKKLGRMVCAAVQPRDVDPDQRDALKLRAKWCESELAEAKRERKDVRQPWPADEDSIEAPDAWVDAVEEALSECGVGTELELVDCTEYPCAAALRPASPPESAEAFKAEMERLMGAVRACPNLRQAFNLEDDEQAEHGLDVYRLDAPCGGVREDFFVLTALDPNGPAFDLLHADRDDKEERDFNRRLYRRADDLSALWPCS